MGSPAAFTSTFKNCHPEGSKHPGGGIIEPPSRSTTFLMWRLLRRTNCEHCGYHWYETTTRYYHLLPLRLPLQDTLPPRYGVQSCPWWSLIASRRFSSGSRSESKCDVELDRRPEKNRQDQNKEPWDLVRTYKTNQEPLHGTWAIQRLHSPEEW